MGTSNFSKKERKSNNKDVQLHAPLNGEVLSLERVDDWVFSEKVMGDGFAMKPFDGTIYSPGSGRVVSVFPTKHAIGIELTNGLEVMVHIGIDTVELEGEPFDIQIEEGEEVHPDTLLAQVSLEEIEKAGKDTTVVVFLTNMLEVEKLQITGKGKVSSGEVVGLVRAKQQDVSSKN